MGAVTRHVGVVGTASTTYNQPYDIARRFATLDHLTGGRAGWNSVATIEPRVAELFGGAAHPDHSKRYERADEFLSVVTQLWDTWEDDALVSDKRSGVFARPGSVHEISHDGEYFSVHGALPFPRPPQGHPVIFQAGASAQGREHAAKWADVVFAAQHVLEEAVEFRMDLRRRAARYGRDPDGVKVLPGISFILGSTEAEARARKDALDAALQANRNLNWLAARVGLPIDVLELDKPFPAHLIGPDTEFSGSVGFRRSLVKLAEDGNLTVRQLLDRAGGSVHHHVVGTSEQVADAMEERFAAGAADGFNLMVDVLPSGVHDVVDMLVPELQRRGLLHEDYEETTLRGNLGLAPMAALRSS
jgi:FMN-dependent oxidoreductase (nitrilotriacetate monooxygenase family)